MNTLPGHLSSTRLKPTVSPASDSGYQSGAYRLFGQQQELPELEYLFRHALVQDAAYDSLLLADRRQLHQMVGEVLEQAYPERLAEFAPVLAQHFTMAGLDDKALDYLILAGDTAANIYAMCITKHMI